MWPRNLWKSFLSFCNFVNNCGNLSKLWNFLLISAKLSPHPLKFARLWNFSEKFAFFMIFYTKKFETFSLKPPPPGRLTRRPPDRPLAGSENFLGACQSIPARRPFHQLFSQFTTQKQLSLLAPALERNLTDSKIWRKKPTRANLLYPFCICACWSWRQARLGPREQSQAMFTSIS